MSEYVKECIFCKAKIRMSDKEGKWRPYNEDGSEHDCKKKNEDITKVNNTIKKIEKENQRTSLSVDEIVRRLDAVGIHIDWNLFLRSTDK